MLRQQNNNVITKRSLFVCLVACSRNLENVPMSFVKNLYSQKVGRKEHLNILFNQLTKLL